MAKIPVEQKSSTPWWLWLLGLLLLAGLLWLLIGLFDGDADEADVAPSDTTAQAVEEPMQNAGAAATGTVTSAAALFGASSVQTLVGREADLSGLSVGSVMGDSTFTVSPQSGSGQMLVALNEVVPASPPGVEGRYDVTEGQTIDLAGTVRAMTQQEMDAWGITSSDLGGVNQNAYIRAQRISITQLVN